MTLNASGPISLGGSTVGQSINLELGVSATALASINATNFRTLAGVPSGQISLSNFYGKSNTAGGFLATEKYSTYTYNSSRYVAYNSSGTVYKVPDGGGGNGLVSMIQYSSTGTQNWNRQGYNGQYTLAVGVDSSNNYYPVGSFDSNNVQISKYNSSDTLQWSSSIGVGVARPDVVNRPVIDSSGNVYVNYREAFTSCCCPTYYYFFMAKFNSSGTFQLGFQLDGGGPQYVGGYGGVGLDSSANIYNAFSGVAYPYGCIVLYKSSSAGTALATSNITKANTQGGSRNGAYTAAGYVFDTANSVGYVSGSGAGGLIYKHDTSLGHVWSYTYTNVTGFQGIALDSSGNIYVVGYLYGGSYGSTTKIMKVNSSGTVQWARTLSASGGYGTEYQYWPAQISVVGTKFVICSVLTNGSGQIAFTFQAPTDGSGTGTFTNAGLTWTYASFSTTATADATNVAGSGGQGGMTRTTTSRTPTVSTSAWTTSTTSF